MCVCPRGAKLRCGAESHSELSAKAVARYLKVHKSTFHRALKRWAEEGLGNYDREPRRSSRAPISRRNSRGKPTVHSSETNAPASIFRLSPILPAAGRLR